jgi:hypothetical protein
MMMPLNITAYEIIHEESLQSVYPQIAASLQFMARFIWN